MNLAKEIADARGALADAQAKSTRAMQARQRLEPGSTRARVTTANANWARAAEHRDRCQDRLDALLAKQAETAVAS